MTYTCMRCGYMTNYKTHFKKHLNSKVPCQPNLSDVTMNDLKKDFEEPSSKMFECDICHKCYTTKETLRVHKKKCIDNNIQSHIPYINNTYNNNTYNNINLNIQIHANTPIANIREFLNENLDYVTDDFILKCAKRMDKGLVEFIKTIRFNPEHPENMNVKLHTKRNKTMYVFKEGRWKICDGNTTLEDMILQGARIINQTFLTNTDTEKIMEEDSHEARIQNWLLSILPNDNLRLLNRLSKSIYAMVLDNHQLILMEQSEPINF